MIPPVTGETCNPKFKVSVKSSELNRDEIIFHLIEATSHYDYGQKVFGFYHFQIYLYNG